MRLHCDVSASNQAASLLLTLQQVVQWLLTGTVLCCAVLRCAALVENGKACATTCIQPRVRQATRLANVPWLHLIFSHHRLDTI